MVSASRWIIVIVTLILLTASAVQQAQAAAPKKKKTKALQASIPESSLPGNRVPSADDMCRWIEEQGGMVNVLVREQPGVGRFAVARRNMKKGDVMAAIPKELCYVAQGPLAPAYLWSEVKDPNSKIKPFLKMLPPRTEVFSYYSIPESYLPIIQNEPTEAAIRSMQGGLQQVWELDGELFKKEIGPDMTYQDLQYAMTLLETRAFAFPNPDGELLVPLIDMGNHINSCKHAVVPPSNTPCPPKSPAKECAVWQAGEEIAAGSEVCIKYTAHMLQDQSLLQYGFLQDGPVVDQLSGLDRHDFNHDEPMAGRDRVYKPFSGTPDAIRSEVARLELLQSALQQFDEQELDKIDVDEQGDPEGKILEKMLTWRKQRQAAIAAELHRLAQLLENAEKCGTIKSLLGLCKKK